MICVRLGLFVLLIAVGASSSALAQSEGKFAIGAQLSTLTAMGPENAGHVGISLLWRFGQSKTGWGWHYGFNWFNTDLSRSIGGVDTDLGRLKVRPVMGGYGYTRVIGRTALTAKLMGGYAFSSIQLTPEATDAYHNRVGGQSVTVKASQAVVIIPEVTAWYNINKKIGVRLSSGYVIARPTVTVASTAGEDKRRVRADNVTFRVGMVYSIF
jgi:hypothetical protein